MNNILIEFVFCFPDIRSQRNYYIIMFIFVLIQLQLKVNQPLVETLPRKYAKEVTI